MRKVIQLILFLILLIIVLLFYYKYFVKKDLINNQEVLLLQNKDQQIDEKYVSKNNVIKNLKYEISVQRENDYLIKSDISEIFIKDGVEIVLMQIVTAKIIDENNNLLIINSDNARFNSKNYNTNFENNIRIKYLGNTIHAENVLLDFEKRYILISKNVMYEGQNGNLKTDNIKINLITKNIDIFMNNNKKNIEATLTK